MMKNDGLLVVVSAPSGCGKDTVIGFMRENGYEFEKTVSCTTRDIRPGETHGVDYWYITREDFEKRIEEGYFLEYNQYGTNLYGTPADQVEALLEKGGTILLKIEVNGAESVRKADLGAVTIFLVPPSMEELERRLRDRGTETEEDIQRRIALAKEELKRAPEFDYIVVNDKVEDCVDRIFEIIRVEKSKYSRMKTFVDKLNIE